MITGITVTAAGGGTITPSVASATALFMGSFPQFIAKLGRSASTALQPRRAPGADQGRTGSRIASLRFGRQQPRPTPRSVALLRHSQLPRPIGYPAPRGQWLSRLADPTIHRRQAARAEQWRFRRRLDLAAPCLALVQPDQRTIPPRQPRISDIRHRPPEQRHDSDTRPRQNRIDRPGAGTEQQHDHDSMRTPRHRTILAAKNEQNVALPATPSAAFK